MPTFTLTYSSSATAELARLGSDAGLAGRLKAVRKALGFMEVNLKHTALNTHKYDGERCPHDKDLFEAYAENNRPDAYRIFFCYPPDQPGCLFIVDICGHP